jgi:hypothetical protein
LSGPDPLKYPEDFPVFYERLQLPECRFRVMARSDPLQQKYRRYRFDSRWDPISACRWNVQGVPCVVGSAVQGAVHHPVEKINKAHYLFKFTFLRDAVAKLNYDYFVWLDADSWFVRNPGDLLRVMKDSPVHVSLEADACSPEARRADWWDCPLADYAGLMRAAGVRSRSIFNVNAGLWIVHRDVILLVTPRGRNRASAQSARPAVGGSMASLL